MAKRGRWKSHRIEFRYTSNAASKPGATNATINRELAALKRMFRLGVQSRKVAEVPYVPMLHERNTRTGFFDRPQFETVLGYLSEDLNRSCTRPTLLAGV